MKNIGILGAGKIGGTIYDYLKTTEHNVTVADKFGNDEVQKLDVFNKADLDAFVSKQDIIVSAAPYDANPLIADSCNEHNVAYFDLTEDTCFFVSSFSRLPAALRIIPLIILFLAPFVRETSLVCF